MPDYLDARLRDRIKAFCKVGRLFDAEKLLNEVGTARLRKTKKWTPLFTAVDRGFHSLVELLLRYDHAQWDLEKSYEGAQRRHRSDLAALILSAPSWSAPIDPVEVLATGDITLARKLHEAGTDFTAGNIILHGAMRNAGGTLNVIAHLGLRSGNVDDQLYSAMVTHADKKHVASVIRFLRAGLDPHKVVPHLDERGRLSGEESTVSIAMFSGKPGFLAALKPSPLKDDAADLIGRAVFLGDDKMLGVLLEAGFELNCKANGGSPALDELLCGRTLKHGVPLPDYGRRHEQPRYSLVEADAFLGAVESFLHRGARWVPDGTDRNEVRMIRDTLLALGDIHVALLLEMLDGHGAARREHLKTLLDASRMKPLARAVRERLPWA
ncbi:MAG: hypothetical protein RLZZ214_1451 [Verrucomicrobiota bacterium]